jgi:TolB-like protein/Tfp pilus assembly protein PilF
MGQIMGFRGAPGEGDRRGQAPDAGPPTPGEVRAALEAVLACTPLKGSERLRRFLQLVVEETLSGRGDRLKEYVIGVEALERPASFDPRTDPVVRVEAMRLRAKLADYYRAEGANDPVIIDLPKGSYVASFNRRPGEFLAASRPDEVGRAPAPDAGVAPADSPSGGPLRIGPPLARHRPRAWWVGLAIGLTVVLIAVAASLFIGRQRLHSPAEPTIAVLPFANASVDRDNDYFCFGLVEDLTTALAQTRGLRVIARTSSMQFTRNVDVREIGRRLKADFIVEGSVRKVAGRLRISAQLIDAGDGAHVWAQVYDRDVRDLLATQTEIARAISGALGPRMVATPAAAVAPLDPDAQELFLKGQYFLNTIERGAPEKALGYLQEAVRRAPGYAPAHAALAAAYAKITLDRPEPRPEEISQAKASARRALELDENQADAHALLAWMAFFHDWNWPEAERGFRRALEVNPNSAVAYHRYSVLLMAERRFDEALTLSRKALDLDPLSALSASNRTLIFLCARRFDEAIAQARDAIELAPNAYATQILLGSSYAEKGMVAEAVAAYRAALAAAPGDTDAAASLGWTLARAGRRDEALTILADLENPARAIRPSHYQRAFLQAALGRADAAFASLDAARARHETELLYLNVDPLFDGLRADPRFKTFLDDLGLPH